MQNDVLEFLAQSNYIEQEYDSQALDDAVQAWEYIMSKRRLNKGRIFQVHTFLMRTRKIEPELIGTYRHPLGNLTGEVAVGGQNKKSWVYVPELMDSWIQAVNNSLSRGSIHTQDFYRTTAVGMHVTFEDIHPFIDGNGRVGRILLNWQLQQFGLPIMVINEEDKQDYYKWFS